MKVAIMQPYFFPYIGYWQLISAVDIFILYDDVNYIKKGYINRNSILLNEKAHRITLEVLGASQNKLICDIQIGNNRSKIIKTVEQAYQKAPKFDTVYPTVYEILNNQDNNLSTFLGNSIEVLSDYLGIETKIVYSSNLEKNHALKGQDKIIDICKRVSASHYINAIGGRELYCKEDFQKNEIDLSFLKSKEIKYIQYKNDFVPNLSIIDLLMFNDIDTIRDFLTRYQLI